MLRYSLIAELDYFTRVKLILHYPFYKVDKALTINSNVFNTFTTAYSYYYSTYFYTLVNSYSLPNLGVNKEDPNLELPKNLKIDNFDKLARR
jgi:hypothetical protein